MMHYASYIKGFLAGLFFTLLSLAGIAAYIIFVKYKAEFNSLSQIDPLDTKNIEESDKEGELGEDELKLIQEAVDYLNGLDSTFHVLHENPDTFGYPDGQDKLKRQGEVLNSKYIGGDADDMETDFILSMKELKDKIKNCKSLSSFSHDLGKVYQSFYKDLTKLAITANNNTIQGSINLSQTSLFGSSEIDNDPISDRLWAALAKTLEFTAAEYDSLADKLMHNISNKLTGLGDDLTVAEKHLSSEGSKRLGIVKETIQQRDKHLKDRDRRREKISSSDKNASIMSGLGMNTNDKLFTSEQSLNESNVRVSNAVKELSKSMPKIIQDALTFSARSIVTVRLSVASMASSMKTINSRTVGLMEDFSRVIDSSTLSVINARKLAIAKRIATSSSTNNGAQPSTPPSKRIDDLRDLIFGLVNKHLEQADGKVATATDLTSTSTTSTTTNMTGTSIIEDDNQDNSNADGGDKKKVTGGRVKLDMSLESSASLAASPPLKFLSQLPPSFASAIEKETSVWFNAFSGRIYRDIARSGYFHSWFCSKLAYILNKGNRPGFVDEFKVDHVSFGSTPPILRNILWTPLFDQQVEAKKQRRASSSSSSDPSTPHIPDPNYLGSLDDPDNDVACLADLSFKSGIQFALSTRIWCNWPRDHYASIPITMKLEIREVSGPIKFGVRRNCSFMSFLEEPQTRFKISVEVGNQFKFKDIPMVSDYVESKIRKLIRKKFVYPNAHKARLLWPRSWWPDGTANDFLPAGPTIDEPSTSSASSLSSPSTSEKHSIDATSSTSTTAATGSEAKKRLSSTSKSKFSWMKKSSDSKSNPDPSSASSAISLSASSSATHEENPTAIDGDDDDDDSPPEVSLEHDLGADLEPEYVSSADIMSHHHRDSDANLASLTLSASSTAGGVRTSIDASSYEGYDGEVDDTSSEMAVGKTSTMAYEENPIIHAPTAIHAQVLSTSISSSSPSSASKSINAHVISASLSSSAPHPQPHAQQPSSSSSSSSTWLSSIAHKTKTKFSEFKEKHLRSNDQDSVASHDSASCDNDASSSSAGDHDHDHADAATSYSRNRSISTDKMHIHVPRPEDFFLPQTSPRQPATIQASRSSSSATMQAPASSSSSSTAAAAVPSSGGNHLQSITRRFQHAKDAIKNEVHKHVEANRRVTGPGTSPVPSPTSAAASASAAPATNPNNIKASSSTDDPNLLHNFPPG